MKHVRACWLRYLTSVVAVALALAIVGTAKADLISLSLPGIQGDVTVAGYEGTIEVLSLTGEIDNSASVGSASGGAGAGKVSFGDFVIHKRFDVSSPFLFKAVLTGKGFSTAVLTFLQAQNKNNFQKTFTITLSNVILTKFGTDATEPNVLAGPEQINITYGRIVLRDEASGTSSCFDTTTNTTC
jgi:type VI secretion system Hcp family effector